MHSTHRPRTPVPPEWETAITAWRTAMRTQGCTPETLATRSTCLRALARGAHAGPWQLTTGQLLAYTETRGWQPSTYRNYVKAWRAFYRWALDAGHTHQDPSAPIPLALNMSQRETMRARATNVRELPAATGPTPMPVPASWVPILAEYRRDELAAGAPLTTIGTRLGHLRQAARALAPLAPAEITTDDLLEWMAGRPWANETRRAIRSSLRAFYRWAARTKRMDADPAATLPRVKASHPLPRPVTEDAYAFALTIADARERLMLRLSAELGLRRGEVAVLHTRDVVETDSGRGLVVHGKNAKLRILPLPATLARELAALPPGYAFPGDDRGHLSPRWVGKLIRDLLPAAVTMHQLRHRFATRAYAASRDLLAVQQVLGHASPATTKRYVAVDDLAMRAVIDAVATQSNAPTYPRTPRPAPAPGVNPDLTPHRRTLPARPGPTQ